MPQPGRAEAISFLRAQIGRIEAGHDAPAQVEAGEAALAARRNAFCEIAPAAAGDMGAAAGFALMLAGREMCASRRPLLWIAEDFALTEQGLPYGPGLAAYGIALADFVLMRMNRRIDLWRAMEDAIKARVFSAIVAEPAGLAGDDLPALLRRLALCARNFDARAILLRPPAGRVPFLAPTPMRFEIAARPAAREIGLARPLPGAPAWTVRHRGAPGSLPGLAPDRPYAAGFARPAESQQKVSTSAALPFDLFAAA